MKKCVSFATLSILVALLALLSGFSPAFASTRHITARQTRSAITSPAQQLHFHPKSWLTHNQYFHGNSYSHNHLIFHGHNQNNSGNEGHNRGYNQNFGSNAGNVIHNHGWARQYQRTNQYFSGNSYSWDRGDFVGYNQNNTGNEGVNDGVNEDHGGNAGNQIVN